MATLLSKQIQKSNIVFAFAAPIAAPDPSSVFSLFTEAERAGAGFSEDQMFRMSIFDLPALKIRIVFERQKLRIEEGGYRAPGDSRIAKEIERIIKTLLPDAPLLAYGLNYEAIYKLDSVIPTQDIMASFMDTADTEDVRDFGWHYTVALDKGKRLETYFFKAVSPMELAEHANFHFDCTAGKKNAQVASATAVLGSISLAEVFVKCYNAMDRVLSSLPF
jgi:hypothetical protein